MAAKRTRNVQRSSSPVSGSRTSPRAIRKLTQAVYRIKAQEIADQCHVNVRTAKRWLSGETQAPYAANALLRGDLTPLGWEGWRLHGRWLISPNGQMLSQPDLRAFAKLRALKAHEPEHSRE